MLASGVKSALRARLCTLTTYPSSLYVQRSVLPPRIVSRPVDVSVTGEMVAFVPLLVCLMLKTMLSGSGTTRVGRK